MSDWRAAFAIGPTGEDGPQPVGWKAVAYRIGELSPEPTKDDLADGRLFSFLWGQRNINPHVVSAIGYTCELAFANLAFKVDGPLRGWSDATLPDEVPDGPERNPSESAQD